jgi:hypothetical protein
MSAPSGGRGVMIRSHCRSRSISKLGTSDGITRSFNPGAWVRRRAINGGSSRSRWKSFAAMVNVPRHCEGTNSARRCKTLHTGEQLTRLLRQLARMGSGHNTAAADLTNSGSPVMARSLSSKWLTADCVTPRRCAAPVMEPTSDHCHQQAAADGRPSLNNRIYSWIAS